MLFPAFVQSHVLKWVATVSSFVFVSLLLVNPSSFVSQNDVNANFVYNDDAMITEDNIIDPSDVSFSPSDDAGYKKALVSYTLKPWDTLSVLAKKYGVSVDQLKLLNNIVAETTINPGKKIYISQTPWFVYVVDKVPVSLMVFANLYNLDQDDLMRVNGEYDAMRPIPVGEAIIIPNKTLPQAYAMWLLQEPQKPVKIIAANTKTPTRRIASTTPVRGVVTQGAGGSKIIKSRKYSFNENNGMTAWYCTYYAAHKARWLFPQLKGNTYFRWVKGNANKWFASAQANGLKTSKTPSVGAIVVFQFGWSRNYSAWHVAVVIDVDRQNKKIVVEEMNYVGFGVVNQRSISMNDSMTEAYDRQRIMWFIPVQPLSAKLEAQYKEQLK